MNLNFDSKQDQTKFRELVKKDLTTTIRKSYLAVSGSLYEPLLVQSVLGHVQNGHGEFAGNMVLPNATLIDVIESAGLNLEKILSVRQGLIDDYREWLELIKKDRTDRLIIKDKPLFGFLPFLSPDYVVDPEYVIKGTILCGLMDSYEWRMKTLEKFEQIAIDGGLLTIGGGESYLVDPEKLKKFKFTIEDLARKEINDLTIDRLKQEGAITDAGNPDAQVAYIRRKIGAGTSDDCAFIMVGDRYMRFGSKSAKSAFFAGFCIDAVDTYDKGVSKPIIGGYDELIAKELKKEFPDTVSDQDITRLIFYISKDNGGELVSSSHKKLVQKMTHISPIKPTILHHYDFLINGKCDKGFMIGFERMPSRRFYQEVNRRLLHFEQNYSLT